MSYDRVIDKYKKNLSQKAKGNFVKNAGKTSLFGLDKIKNVQYDK
jgi:hypothetical protein